MDFILAMYNVGGRAMCSKISYIWQVWARAVARLKLPQIGSGRRLPSPARADAPLAQRLASLRGERLFGQRATS